MKIVIGALAALAISSSAVLAAATPASEQSATPPRYVLAAHGEVMCNLMAELVTCFNKRGSSFVCGQFVCTVTSGAADRYRHMIPADVLSSPETPVNPGLISFSNFRCVFNGIGVGCYDRTGRQSGVMTAEDAREK